MHQHPDSKSGRLSSRMSFIYNYETSTLTPFVKPHDVINLATQNVLLDIYVQF